MHQVTRSARWGGSLLCLALLALCAPAAPLAQAGNATTDPVDPVTPGRPPFTARVAPLDEATTQRMVGVSWREGCPVSLAELRAIQLTYWGYDAKAHTGQLVVNQDIAESVTQLFQTMYRQGFPIQRMDLVDRFEGDDDASMAANNTSAFNCRAMTGAPGKWSVHSYGRAVDINPVTNPYVKQTETRTIVLPEAGRAYLDRSTARPGMIVRQDGVWKAWTAAGFEWGGDWQTLKDYQHFELVRKARR